MTPPPRLLRRALWTSVFFNLGGASVFAFPDSPLGRLAGLPASVPPLYRATVALFVLMFAGAYAWLAAQPDVDRPMVVFSALGKAGFFLVVVALWLAAALPGRTVLVAGGDLVLAALFVRGLAAR